MNQLIQQIQQEIQKTKQTKPTNDYQDGVKDGYIQGLNYTHNLLKTKEKETPNPQELTISKTNSKITIQCQNPDHANTIFNWLTTLK